MNLWAFRVELLLQRANKIQNTAVDCEEKLTLAKNTLQAVSSPAFISDFRAPSWMSGKHSRAPLYDVSTHLEHQIFTHRFPVSRKYSTFILETETLLIITASYLFYNRKKIFKIIFLASSRSSLQKGRN